MSNICFDFRDKDVVLLPTELGEEEDSANVSALLTLKTQDTPEKEAG
jgi:hypothetical protein